MNRRSLLMGAGTATALAALPVQALASDKGFPVTPSTLLYRSALREQAAVSVFTRQLIYAEAQGGFTVADLAAATGIPEESMQLRMDRLPNPQRVQQSVDEVTRKLAAMNNDYDKRIGAIMEEVRWL